VISAEYHVDLCWLPPDLFTRGASATMRERMAFVADGPDGPTWKTKRGANLGAVNGMGSAGRQYIPGAERPEDLPAAKKPRKQKNRDNANVSGRVARVRCIREGGGAMLCCGFWSERARGAHCGAEAKSVHAAPP